MRTPIMTAAACVLLVGCNGVGVDISVAPATAVGRSLLTQVAALRFE